MNRALRLLLVEDSARDARVLTELLKDATTPHPPQLTHVSSLKQAINHIASQDCDCVLLDLHLPDSDGIEGVDRLRELNAMVTIVVLTGHDDQQTALAALRCGAQDYVVKGKHDGDSLLLLLRHSVERDQLVIALNQQSQRDYYRASHDALTGLPNRLLFEDRLHTAISQSQRQGQPSVVCFVDLDGFKAVNDVHGHACGDALLQKVAQTLQDTVRAGDTVARLGGDEFAVLLTHAEDAAQVAQRMVQSVAAIDRIGEARVQIGASIGLAQHPLHGQDSEQLLANADQAMYQAKLAGKGQCCFYKAGSKLLHTEATKTLDLDTLHLHFQPWYQTGGAQCMGLEALIRRHGASAADAVLREAEHSQLLPLLGAWVLSNAARQWLVAAARGQAPPRLAINITATEAERRDYAATVLGLLRDLNMPAAALQLELPEDALIAGTPALLGNLHLLREQGVHIAVDRFGRHQAALGRLESLPVNVVKLDARHVQALRTQAAARAFMDGVTGYVQALGHELIICGVETQADLDNLGGLTHTGLQGFGLAAPAADTTLRASLLPC